MSEIKNSFGFIFAGNMANRTSGSLDNAMDYRTGQSGMRLNIVVWHVTI